ncbi:universal stress protein [Mycolicibacterium senegalense]|uniref:UspA domain-containing protein n=4 Tax=Mycobacteriaceae TaxID=1762 RepID=A0ABX3VB85_9MYCO|nr:hypothetical protein AWB98_10135 [Mycolicibacterium conceptionense]QZA24000.1 universal stress protein [Mycolicibacterium senegalense]
MTMEGMNSFGSVVAFAALWIVTGLVTGFWMIRRGHHPLWLLIAVVLGPLFVPIALERAEHGSRLVFAGPDGPPSPRTNPSEGLRILIGLDGSPESQEALTTASKLFGLTCERIVLAEVVSFDATEESGRAEVDAASARLAAAADVLKSRSIPVSFEVLAGPPAKTLRSLADRQDIDLIIIGRRGRGLTNRLMGSVSADLVQHSPVPVLLTPQPTKSAARG